MNLDRRTFLATGVSAAAAIVAPGLMAAEPESSLPAPAPASSGSFWPNGARMAVSLSLMFEGGGQPISGAGGFI